MATWQQWTVDQNQASLFVTCCLLISRYWIRASHPQGVLESMVSMQQLGQIGENSLLLLYLSTFGFVSHAPSRRKVKKSFWEASSSWALGLKVTGKVWSFPETPQQGISPPGGISIHI